MTPNTFAAAMLQLLTFFSTYRDGLANAAEMLGGPVAARRVHNLVDALSVQQPRMTRWMGRELVALHRLLTLQDVGDFDRPESYYFSLIDPADPAVADICLLTDGFSDCLRSLIVEDLVVVDDFDLAA
jgi:hypothetical protein